MQWIFQKAFSQATELTPVSAKAIVLRGRDVLLLRKPSGKWDLPGGKIESGETVYQGLLREVREEAGLDVSVSEYIGAIDRSQRQPSDPKGPLYTFLCNVDANLKAKSLRLSKEHIEATFANLWQADEFPMSRPSRSALAAAQNHLES